MCLGVLRVEDDLRKWKMILTRYSWNRGPVKSGESGLALGVNLAAGSTEVKYMLSGDWGRGVCSWAAGGLHLTHVRTSARFLFVHALPQG